MLDVCLQRKHDSILSRLPQYVRRNRDLAVKSKATITEVPTDISDVGAAKEA